MNVKSLLVRSAMFAAAAIFLFPCRIEAQQVRAHEGVRPDEMADLVAVAMTPSIAFPAPQEMVDIAVEVRNQATHAEQNVVVSLFAGTTRVAEKAINLKSGETTTVHLSWEATLEGKVTLTAQVDPDFKFIERERHDNLRSIDFVVARQPSNEVDLAVLGIESVMMPDQSTVLRTGIRNNGKVVAQVPLIIRTDKQIAEVRLVEVAGDATITVEIPWADSKPPTQLSAEINPRHRSSEKRTADNLLVKDLRSPVDLRIDGLSVSAAQFEASRPRQVTISFRVVNAGATAISQAFRTSVFPGVVKPDNAQPFGVHNVTTAGLAAGAAVYISHTIVSPVSAFDVRVEADADHVIAESDENNNIATSPFKNPAPDIGRWVSLGPRRINDGGLGAVGRLSAIAIHPVLPGTIYVGGNLCGVWKTTNNGLTWQPIADALPSLSIAGLAIDSSSPERVYVATAGAGVFRSDDGGTSWTQLPGSPNAEVGSGLLVHPTNRNVLYLTSVSGIHRSRDFGATWQLLLQGARVTDLVMDVMSPDTLYAAREGNGVYKTINGGDGWNQLTNGLPLSSSGTIRHITLAICRNSPANLYAGYSTSSGFRLFRTTDAGASWSLQSTPDDPSLFNDVIGVDPINPRFVYITGVKIYRRHALLPVFVESIGTHADHHALATDLNTRALYSLNDGGIYRSFNRGVTWEFIGEGITNVEFYDHAVAFKDPNLVIGGTQDNGTIRFDGTSTVWKMIKDGDGATVDIDPANSQILYAMNQFQASIVRITNGSQSCIGCSLPLTPLCYNLHFQVHPTTPSTLLASCVSLWRANNPQCPQCPNPDAGSSGTPGVWSVILPVSVTAPGIVMRSAIDSASDLYYAGTSNGELWAGPSGANWRKVFTPISAGSVTDIEIDLDNPAIIYVSIEGDTRDRVYRLRRLSSIPTTATMISQPITSNLPIGLTVKTLSIDRMTPFTIYAGTNRGVFRGRSLDNGLTWSWTSYNNGMPAADIRDLEVHPVTGVMRAASHGRGAFEVNTDSPIGSLLAAEGKVTLLRVHDVGTGFGPPTDFIDVEVVIALDSQPGRFFGFQLRNDANRIVRRDMLNLLRDAFKRERRVRIDYVRTGVRNGRIVRVVQIP